MKKLEKLQSFQIQNEKLGSILGGQGGPAHMTTSIGVGSPTGAGETSMPTEWGCQCSSYTSDTDFGNN
ncbi:hypothetical protein SB725_30160, partial [Pseudomonas sp. SIMBA_041]